MAIVLRNIDQIFKSDGSEFSSGGGMELGIQATTAGGDTDYNFGVTPVSSITEMDTSSLPAGSTHVGWNHLAKLWSDHRINLIS